MTTEPRVSSDIYGGTVAYWASEPTPSPSQPARQPCPHTPRSPRYQAGNADEVVVLAAVLTFAGLMASSRVGLTGWLFAVASAAPVVVILGPFAVAFAAELVLFRVSPGYRARWRARCCDRTGAVK